MKYRYVIFGYGRDYFQTIFADAINELGVEYIANPIENTYGKGLRSLLYSIHTNDYVNKVLKLPFKDKWLPYFYNKPSITPICFVFLMDWCNKKYEPLYAILRKNYPGCKLCLYLEDLIASRPDYPCELFNLFDLIVSYDKKEAQRINATYYHSFLSGIKDIEAKYNSDFGFVGRSKDRDTLIFDIYDKLIKEGFKCDFVLTGVPRKNRKKTGITYLSHDLPYREYLSHIMGTKCIVEIMHHDAEGFTLRTWESLLYNKKLLSNNKSIKSVANYSASRICSIFDNRDLHEFLEKPIEGLEDAKRKEFSSVGFIEALDKILTATI